VSIPDIYVKTLKDKEEPDVVPAADKEIVFPVTMVETPTGLELSVL